MMVTHPHITSVFMEWVTASCSSFDRDCCSLSAGLDLPYTLKHEDVEMIFVILN